LSQFRKRVIETGNDNLRIDGSKKGWSLPQSYYKDPEIFELEKKAIIFNTWIFAGHASQIPNPGDYFLFNLLEESAIIIRSDDGSINAFYNVCLHRGSHICKEQSGNTKKLVCPYHAWGYDLDGKLIAARGMPDNFNKNDIQLHSCNLDLIGGMIFINFSENPTSLSNAKSDLADVMEMYDFENMKIAAHKTYPIAANWKVTLENYQECYHCAPSHPEYSLSHTLKVVPEKFDELQKPMESRMEACGVKNIVCDQQYGKQEEGQEQFTYGRYALYEKYKTGSKDGEPVAPLLGNLKGYDHGGSDMNIGFLTHFLIYNDHALVYVFRPTGHQSSVCDQYWLVRGDAEEGTDYDLEKLTWLWNVTTLADERIIVDNQKGINSKKYAPGPLSDMEYLLDKLYDWYLAQLEKVKSN
jgi:phenylpropionate dioxygenase-like ring-hydroxylating dioxygenase large terminal subunit